MLNRPLADAEMDELDAILMSSSDDTALELSGLHGFLTAIVSGPETVMPSEWLPIVFGERGFHEFETREQVERAIMLVMRLMNEIIATLIEEREAFEPILLENRTTKPPRPYACAWCDGYLEGVLLRAETWQPYIDDVSAIETAFQTIVQLRGDEPGKRLYRRAARHEALADAATTIHRFFYNKRKTSRTIRVEAVQVGRNDPCSCGSGKKSKKCCGAR